MEETEFLKTAGEKILDLQEKLEDDNDDVSCIINGHVLTVELDDGGQVVVNIQAPMQEIWLASFAGGYHFKFADGVWKENHSGKSLDEMTQEAVDKMRRG